MTIAVAILAVLVFVLSGVVLELFRDVRQLRDAAGILDRPLSVDIGSVAGSRPSEHGLPVELDSSHAALVLFLSDRCGTCRSIAAGLDRQLPRELWIVLEAQSPMSARKFVESYDLTSMVGEGRLLLDVDGAIAGRIGLDTTPVGFHVEGGRLVRATTVPSRRYLLSILPQPLSLRNPTDAPKVRETWDASSPRS
jgi:hypothetical protein